MLFEGVVVVVVAGRGMKVVLVDILISVATRIPIYFGMLQGDSLGRPAVTSEYRNTNLVSSK